MQFYPLGSSSFNQIYNTALAITASVANYAETASYGVRIVTASYALQGVPGLEGNPGTCSYVPGDTGNAGPSGFTGGSGGVSTAVATP